jgi:hypothetical protein
MCKRCTQSSDIKYLIDKLFPNTELEFYDLLLGESKGYLEQTFKKISKDQIQLFNKIISAILTDYFSNNDPSKLVFGKFFNIFMRLSLTFTDVILTTLDVLKIQYDQHIQKCSFCGQMQVIQLNNDDDYHNVLMKQNQDNMCIYFTIFDILVNDINVLVHEKTRSQFANLTDMLISIEFTKIINKVHNFNNIHIFQQFVNKLVKVFKQFTLYFDDMTVGQSDNSAANVKTRMIILLNQGYQIQKLLSDNYDANDLIFEYLQVNHLNILIQEIVIYLGRTNDNSLKMHEYLLDRDYLTIEHTLFLNKHSESGYFIEKIVALYRYIRDNYPNKIVTLNKTKELLLSLIDKMNIDCEFIQKLVFCNIPDFLATVIINKLLIIDYGKISYEPFINWIMNKLNVNLLPSYNINMNIFDPKDIANLNAIIKEIKSLTKKAPTSTNSIKINYINKIKLHNSALNVTSIGVGVTLESFRDLRQAVYKQILDVSGEINLDDQNNNEWFEAYGLLHAYSLINYNINVIPAYLIKFLLGKKLKLSDIMSIQFIETLYGLRNLSDQDITNLELTMTVTIKNDNKTIQYDLIEYGNSVVVTKENLETYIQCITDYYTCCDKNSPRYQNIVAFVTGFEMLFHNVSKFLNDQQLFDVLMYMNKYPAIDKSLLNQTIVCKNNEIKEWLLEYLETLDDVKLCKFFEFGSALNYYNMQSKLNIYMSSSNNKSLPTAQTCFKRITIPYYQSKNIMQNKFDIALDNFVGFQEA